MRRSLLACAILAAACEGTTVAPARDAAPDDVLANDITSPDAAPDVAPLDAKADDAASDAAPVDARPPPAVPFGAGPYGTAVRDMADDFTVPTQDGDWSFRDRWSGVDSYVFLAYAPRALRFGNGTDYSVALFDSPIADLLARSPRNVHYFFLWLTDEEGFGAVRESWLGEIDQMKPEDRDWWRAHVHFVSTAGRMLDNWVGRMITARSTQALPYKRYDPLQFAIDRHQRIREVGQLGTLAASGLALDLTRLANEPIYYNWEWDRDQRMARERVTVVELARARTAHDTFDVDVELPTAAALEGFDTMEVDLSMECPNHRDGECGAWDYLSFLWVCDQPTRDADAGSSDAGDAGDAGAPAWRCDREIARWITSYWREGRWVTDISGMMPFLRAGGRTHFRWNASGQFDPRSTDYNVSLSLRLSNRARGMRPVDAVPLWQGGGWDAMYDARHAPVRVTVPGDVRRVDLYTLTTGHGGVAPTNCAEFCNHEHRFAVNGAEHLQSFPGARTMNGCADRVDAGVVPNQHGTWYFGRGGWCPGFDVAPWVVDVTREIHPGTESELRYTTTYGGRPVAAGLGNIVLSSYLVYWR